MGGFGRGGGVVGDGGLPGGSGEAGGTGGAGGCRGGGGDGEIIGAMSSLSTSVAGSTCTRAGESMDCLWEGAQRARVCAQLWAAVLCVLHPRTHTIRALSFAYSGVDQSTLSSPPVSLEFGLSAK